MGGGQVVGGQVVGGQVGGGAEKGGTGNKRRGLEMGGAWRRSLKRKGKVIGREKRN